MTRVSLARRLALGHRLRTAKERGREWMQTPPDAIAARQLASLRERWREAVANVPYYRSLVEAGDAPRDFGSLAEYRDSVPVLMRETLVDQAEQFARDAQPHHVLMTAGSTGVPLRFGNWQAEEADHTGVNQWVGRFQNGMTLADRVFMLWGHSHLLGTGVRGDWKGALRKTKDGLLGYRRMDAYHLEPEISRAYLDVMARYQPQVVIGYACAVDMWVRNNMGRSGLARQAGVRLCIACSEMFPFPDSRDVIGEFLGCPVIMEYGGVDFGVCAYEIADRGEYRTFWWSHYLEVEEGTADGQLLVTNLTARYLPLFRYRNGDACEGARLAATGHVDAFKAIGGRVNDVLDMPDGRKVHSVGLFHCVHQEPVRFIQLVVGRDGSMRLRLASDTLPDGAEARIRKRLTDLHPALTSCPIDVVADVAANRAGKRRWIVHE